MTTNAVTIRAIAAALKLTKRRCEMRALGERWPFEERSVRGGRQRLYPLSALSPDVQAALAKVALEASIAQKASAPAIADAMSIEFDAKPENIKRQARERLELVQAFQRLRNRGYTSRAAAAAIVSQRSIDRATLLRYLALVRGRPEQLWICLLAPRYAGRTGKLAMSAEAWEILKGDYLRVERPSAQACITRLREGARARPDWTLPSNRTLTRRLQAIPRGVRVLARHGPKAMQQLYPPQQRSKTALRALAIVNGDGYKHNVWVRFPDGEVVRAKTWFWQDVHSAKILAWRTDKSEHTEMIRLAFGDLVEAYGIPEAVTLDNTLAAANKAMSGGIRTRYRFKVRDEEPDGVFKLLGCDVHWATPGHGQAKPIERAFGTGGVGEYIDKAPEFAGAWTGASPLDKPEYDGKTRAIELVDLIAVIKRETDAWNARQGRRSPIAQGRSFDEIFAESYAATPIRKAAEAQRRLWLLATEPVTANAKDGSIAIATGRITRSAVAPTQSNRYWAPAMVECAGKKLVARFDPAQLHVGLHVYTTDGRYVCFAECHAPQGFNDANAAREHSRDRRAFMRSQRELLNAESRMSAREAAKAMPRGAAPDAPPAPTIPAAKVVRPQFGHPLERPYTPAPEMNAREREEMQRFEADFAKPARTKVSRLKDDHEKFDHWMQLDRLRREGALEEDEERFWQQFQQDAYFRFRREEEAKFDEQMAARA